MKATVSRTELLKKLKIVRIFISKNSLSNTFETLFRSTEDKLHISCLWDSTLRLEMQIDATDTEPGSFQIEATKLNRYVRALSGEFVVLSSTAAPQLFIRGDSQGRFKVACSSEGIWVDPVEDTLQGILKLDRGELIRLLKKLRTSLCMDGHRYGMNALHIAREENCTSLCTTDGHRLTLCKIDQQIRGSYDQCNLPFHMVLVMMEAIPQWSTWTIRRGEKIVEVTADGFRMIAPFDSPSDFPKYKVLLSSEEEFNRTIRINVLSLKSALNRAKKLFSNRSRGYEHGTRFEFESGSTTVRLVTKNRSGDEYVDQIEIEEEAKKNTPLAFNCFYLMDLMGALSSDMLEMKMVHSLSPTHIRDGDDLFVIMPMRVNEFS